ncbi:MAG: response regulator transcription factor, partial [Desulfomicrobium sp.]|nr:response regulator transcription factor [Desulfomicrobium sp.]
MSAPKRILIIDDHPLYRDGLKARLAARPDFNVVGEAGTCAEGLRLTQTMSPDLAIIDISLSDGSGIELTREIRLSHPDMPVLIVSMHAKLDFIAAAFQAGASGYMSKESGGEGILQAIGTVLSGGQYLDGSLSPSVLRRLNDMSG